MSFLRLINKYNTEINLILNTNGNYQYNEKNELVKKNDNKKISINEQLTYIFQSLSKAPVYYLESQPMENFLKTIKKYAENSNPSEKRKIEQTVMKIQTIVKQESDEIHSCFLTESAKKINLLLDMDETQISEREYFLLYDLANLLAYNRLKFQIFYRQSAIVEKIKALRQHYPNLMIKVNEHGDWSPSVKIDWDLSTINITELQFAIFLIFRMKNSDLKNYDPIFLQKIIQMKTISQNDEFKEILEICLMFYVISELCEKWDDFKADKFNQLNSLLRNAKTPSDEINQLGGDFITESRSYHGLKTIIFTPFSAQIDFNFISKDLFKIQNDTNAAFDKWYEAIFNKIRKYKNLHPTVDFPLIEPEEFVNYKNFFNTKNLQVHLLNKIKKWNTEEAEKLNDQKKSSSLTKSKQLSKANQSTQEKISQKKSESELSKIEENSISAVKEISISTPESKENQVEILAVKPQSISELPFINEKEKYRELLIKSTPFIVKDRVTAWYTHENDQEILNEESIFIHNFAWAANHIIWKYGMKYIRKNEHGVLQPAIVMLCKVEHHLYKKPVLRRITTTFDHEIKEDNDCSLLEFDPQWQCYHRTLTPRQQVENEVEEYISNGKYQFDYPPLPSQHQEFNFHNELINRKFPDGSYITSIDGPVITIMDPKNDSKNVKCILRLFVVK